MMCVSIRKWYDETQSKLSDGELFSANPID